MMADTKYLLQFFERGVGVFLDLGTKFLRVELAPSSPTGFRSQCPLLDGIQIPINRTAGQIKPPGGLGLGTAALDEFDHSCSQVQRISFHAHKPIRICPNVNMKFYSVSMSQLDKTIEYIKGQESHHRKMTFQEEFLALLKKHRIEYDARYLWK